MIEKTYFIEESKRFYPYKDDENYFVTIRKEKEKKYDGFEYVYKLIEYVDGKDNGDFLVAVKKSGDKVFTFDKNNMFGKNKDELIDGIIEFMKYFHQYDLKKEDIEDFVEF